MKNNIILLLLGSIICFSCDDKDYDETNKEESVIKIQSVYLTTEDSKTEKPDVGSNIYVYYNIDSMDLLKYEYLEDGKFIFGTDTISPIQTDTIDLSGYASLKPKYIDRTTTIAIRSRYYQGRLSIESFSTAKSIVYKLVNKP